MELEEEADEMDEADVEEEQDVEEADEAERTMYKRLQLFLTDVSAYSRSRTRVLRSLVLTQLQYWYLYS